MANGSDAKAPSAAAEKLHLLATCASHSKAVSSVQFSPAHDVVASASADCSLRVWRIADGAVAGPSNSMTHSQGVNDVAWNPQGNYLASASDDLTAKIWDAETGNCLITLPGHTNYVFCCQFDPVGHILATSSFDETIHFWDVRTGRCIRELPAHSDPVSGIDFSYDGTVLASCSFDGLLRLWDTHLGHCLKTLAIDNGSSPLSSVRFSPNGQYVLQASLNNKARLVNFETGKVAKTYTGHKNSNFCSQMTFVTTVGSNPLIAAGSEDGSILLWDVNSKQVVNQIPGRASSDEAGDGHCAPVLCMSTHQLQPLLASAGHDGDCTVKIWSAGACSSWQSAGGWM